MANETKENNGNKNILTVDIPKARILFFWGVAGFFLSFAGFGLGWVLAYVMPLFWAFIPGLVLYPGFVVFQVEWEGLRYFPFWMLGLLSVLINIGFFYCLGWVYIEIKTRRRWPLLVVPFLMYWGIFWLFGYPNPRMHG